MYSVALILTIEGLNAVNLGTMYEINVFTGSNVTSLEVSALSYVKSVLEIIVFENVDVIDDSFDNDAEAPHIPGKNFF